MPRCYAGFLADVDADKEIAWPSRVWQFVESIAKSVDKELDEMRFFLLYFALGSYAEQATGDAVFYDLTGSAGRNALAASMLHSWRRCVSLEPTAARCDEAAALFETSRRAGEATHTEFDVLDSRRLWQADWHDANVAVFDASRRHYADWIDEDRLVSDVLVPGLERAEPGTCLILITSGQGGGNLAKAELVDSHVSTSPNAVLRVDLLRVTS